MKLALTLEEKVFARWRSGWLGVFPRQSLWQLMLIVCLIKSVATWETRMRGTLLITLMWETLHGECH